MQDVNSLTEIRVLPQKRELLIDSLVKKMEQAIYNECLFEDRISLNVEYTSGIIEIHMKSNGDCEVGIVHFGNEHNSPTLESTISGLMPDWYSIKSQAEKEEKEEKEYQDYLWKCCRYL